MKAYPCPNCSSDATYADRKLWICSQCDCEWDPDAAATATEESSPESKIIKDAYGNALSDGDAVTVIKDLKVKGSSSVVKIGTKIKSIHLIDGVDGHDIACKIDGFGAMNIKSEFVKKN